MQLQVISQLYLTIHSTNFMHPGKFLNTIEGVHKYVDWFWFGVHKIFFAYNLFLYPWSNSSWIWLLKTIWHVHAGNDLRVSSVKIKVFHLFFM